jgi:hypothetical protein
MGAADDDGDHIMLGHDGVGLDRLAVQPAGPVIALALEFELVGRAVDGDFVNH